MPRRKFPMGQSRYFYTPTWTKKVDAAFCTFLHVHAIMGNPQTNPRHPMNPAFLNACDALNDYAKRNWSYGFFLSRLHILGLSGTKIPTGCLAAEKTGARIIQTSLHLHAQMNVVFRCIPSLRRITISGSRNGSSFRRYSVVNTMWQDTTMSEDVGDFSLDGSINSDVQFLGWKQDEEPEVIDLVTSENEKMMVHFGSSGRRRIGQKKFAMDAGPTI
ncbi:UNVERIFIED_CONTAM: hypothetical protein Sindi_0336200 [Sesamum indicum]